MKYQLIRSVSIVVYHHPVKFRDAYVGHCYRQNIPSNPLSGKDIGSFLQIAFPIAVTRYITFQTHVSYIAKGRKLIAIFS